MQVFSATNVAFKVEFVKQAQASSPFFPLHSLVALTNFSPSAIHFSMYVVFGLGKFLGSHALTMLASHALNNFIWKYMHQ